MREGEDGRGKGRGRGKRGRLGKRGKPPRGDTESWGAGRAGRQRRRRLGWQGGGEARSGAGEERPGNNARKLAAGILTATGELGPRESVEKGPITP